ncbi:unnamed protein product [Caenorhabditis bovis]|uniref:FERM domain-containing protein n=1 Tax=Caenorhabditis bovis TaxID=2654633 RepID=A0A8S1FAD6_9PELO|nr:unnamed protein product [Caenorhabditis bovis]
MSKKTSKLSTHNMMKVYPEYMFNLHDENTLLEHLRTAMKRNETRNDAQLDFDFLTTARGLMTYGASFFDVDIISKRSSNACRPCLAGVNDRGLHLIFKQTWVVKNLRFDEFHPIFVSNNVLEIDALRSRDEYYVLASPQIKFLKAILQKFQKRVH